MTMHDNELETRELIKFKARIQLNFSQLSLNGHLYKTDTWCWSLPFLTHFTVQCNYTLYKTGTSLRQTTDTLETINRNLRSELCSEKYLKMET